MPSRRSGSSGQRRAQGGGRTPNSEPKIQVFKDFAGVNFDMANWPGSGISVDTAITGDDQTDLQMNYLTLQNNVMVTQNKTLETRDDLVTLFNAPANQVFTGPVCLIGDYLYAAKFGSTMPSPGMMVGFSYVPNSMSSPKTMSRNVDIIKRGNADLHWTSLSFYDGKLIALTEMGDVWTGSWDTQLFPPEYTPTPEDMAGVQELKNAVEVPDPQTSLYNKLSPNGYLQINGSQSSTHPFRISIAYSWVNEFGPTAISPTYVFYANHPVTEWNSDCFLTISDTINTSYGIKAVELYYSTDNASTLLFLGRVDIGYGSSSWRFDWHGYLDATSMWPTANLIAPTENYTKGAPASHMTVIDGRMYFWGQHTDASHFVGYGQRLYIGGNPGNLMSISPGTGGGFVDVEPGDSSVAIRHVCKYKTQSGNSIVTMLCDADRSRNEQRYNLVENSISLSNEQSMKSWQAEQVAGAIGCKGPDGALVCQDGLYTVNRYGLGLTTMTMEYNSQIRTTYVSDAIKCIFTDGLDNDQRLSNAHMIECDGILYLALGAYQGDTEFNNVLFCYDIDAKAWWTYTLDTNEDIINLFHIDNSLYREGIGIVTASHIYMLPTTNSDSTASAPRHGFLLETAQLSTQMPQQGWQWLSQLEFHFDWFVGSASIQVRMVDMFGREIKVDKTLSEQTRQNDYVVRMRIDQRVMSYVIRISGTARFRMTHWLARVYTMSNKVGQVWGFDDSVSHRSAGSVRPTFKSYNDVRKAIFT